MLPPQTVHAPKEIVSMQILWMNVEFQMLITEPKSTETKYHCLNDTRSASFDQIVTALFLQC